MAAVITVFAGFAPTYYLRSYFTATPLIPLLHLHGLVFTSWLVLFVAQTTLVAAHRTNIHRRLGVAGGVVAVLMILVGASTAVIRAKQGASPPGGPSPLAFLVVPLGDMLVFAVLVGAGFYFRRRTGRAQTVDAAGHYFNFDGRGCSTTLHVSPVWPTRILCSDRRVYYGLRSVRPHHLEAHPSRHGMGGFINHCITTAAPAARGYASMAHLRQLVDSMGRLNFPDY